MTGWMFNGWQSVLIKLSMALPDYPHPDDTTRQRWLDYRQALRDIPQQKGFPFDVVWPEKPE